MSAPSSASASEMARPMPRPPPVTSATRPSSVMSVPLVDVAVTLSGVSRRTGVQRGRPSDQSRYRFGEPCEPVSNAVAPATDPVTGSVSGASTAGVERLFELVGELEPALLGGGVLGRDVGELGA